MTDKQQAERLTLLGDNRRIVNNELTERRDWPPVNPPLGKPPLRPKDTSINQSDSTGSPLPQRSATRKPDEESDEEPRCERCEHNVSYHDPGGCLVALLDEEDCPCAISSDTLYAALDMKEDTPNTTLTVNKLIETFRLCKEREWMMEGELLPTHTLTRRSKTLFTPWIVTRDNDVDGSSMGFEWVVKPITDDLMASATQVRFCGPMGLRMANEYAAWRMSMEPIMWQWAAPEEFDTKHYTFTVGSIEWRVHVNNNDGVRPTVDVYAGNVLCCALNYWPRNWTRPAPESVRRMAIESVLLYLS